MGELAIQHAIRKALNLDGRCRVVRNQVGFDDSNKVRYGLGNGSADLIGLLRSGRCFAVEVKVPGGRLSAAQECWWRAYRVWGGLGGVATSVAEALALLDEACPR